MRRLWRRMRRSKSLCMNRRSTRDSIEAIRHSVDDQAMGDSAYKYLTADEMKSLGDDSIPMDTSRDETMDKSREYSTDFINQLSSAENIITPQKLRETYARFCSNVDNVDIPRHPITAGFLVSFMVDARGGAMRGCRHSGVRVIVPPRKAAEPMRITCRYLRKERLLNPPPLMEGEALASRILEMGPAQAKFLGAVIIEVPHFASLRGREREIVIMRSDNGQTWKEHCSEASDETVQDLLNESFDGNDLRQLEDLSTSRRTRIITTEFPHYFAIISRLRQEIHTVGPDGGMVSSTVVPQVQAVFPPGALTKKIKVGLQAQPIPVELVTKLLGHRVAVSPIATIEPRRRKFHKPITLTIPVPEAASQGMINPYSGDSPTLRLLCSITGGATRAQWEDVTGSTPLTFVNDCVSFTTTVSARFWLVDCQNFTEATALATELYREAIHVPLFSRFVVFAKRHDAMEGRLRVFCMTDDKEEKTLEQQEHFVEVARSRDVEVMENKWLYLEFGGNLVPVTKTGDQLCLKFKSFKENRLRFTMRIKDHGQKPMARVAFMKDKMLSRQEVSQSAVCTLNIQLPSEICPEANVSVDSDTGFKSNYRIHSMLPEIAEAVSERWQRLAELLGMGDNDIAMLSAEYSGDSVQQATAMLRLWANSHHCDSAGEQLSAALQELGLPDVGAVVNGSSLANLTLMRSDLEQSAPRSNIEERHVTSKGERVVDSSNIEERPGSGKEGRAITPRYTMTSNPVVVQLGSSDSANEQTVTEQHHTLADSNTGDKSLILKEMADVLAEIEKSQPRPEVPQESHQDIFVDEPVSFCEEKDSSSEITTIQRVDARDIQQSYSKPAGEDRTHQMQQTHGADMDQNVDNATISTTITTTSFTVINDQRNESTSPSSFVQKDGSRTEETGHVSSDFKLDQKTELIIHDSQHKEVDAKDSSNDSLVDENLQSFQERREFWEEISSTPKEESISALTSGLVNAAFLGEEEVDRMEKCDERAHSPYEVVRDVNNVETINLSSDASDLPSIHDSHSSSICDDNQSVPDEIMMSHSSGKLEGSVSNERHIDQSEVEDRASTNFVIEDARTSEIDSTHHDFKVDTRIEVQSKYENVNDEAVLSEAELNLDDNEQEINEPLNSETHPHILDESESVSFVSETLNDILDAPDDINGSPVSHCGDVKVSESDNKFVSEHLDLIDELEYGNQMEKPAAESPLPSNQSVKFDVPQTPKEFEAETLSPCHHILHEVESDTCIENDVYYSKSIVGDSESSDVTKMQQQSKFSEIRLDEAYAIASDIVSDIKTLVMEHPDIKSVYTSDESDNTISEKINIKESDMVSIIQENETEERSNVSSLPKYSPDSAFTEKTSSKVEAYLGQLSSSDARHVELVQRVTERKSATFEAKRGRIESVEITDEDLCGSGNDLSPVESHMERLRQMSVPYLDDDEMKLLEASAGERKHALNLHALQLSTTDQYYSGDVKIVCSTEQAAPTEIAPPEKVSLDEAADNEKATLNKGAPSEKVAPNEGVPIEQDAPDYCAPPDKAVSNEDASLERVTPSETIPTEQVAPNEGVPIEQHASDYCAPPEQATPTDSAPTENIVLSKQGSLSPKAENFSHQSVMSTHSTITESSHQDLIKSTVDSTASMLSYESTSQPYIEDNSVSSFSTVIEQKSETENAENQIIAGLSDSSHYSEFSKDIEPHEVSPGLSNKILFEDASDLERQSDNTPHICVANADEYKQTESTIKEQNIMQSCDKFEHLMSTENQAAGVLPSLDSGRGENTVLITSEHPKSSTKRVLVDCESPSSAESRYYTAGETGGSTSEGSVGGSRPTSSDVELLLTNPSSIASGSQDYVTAATSPSRVSPSNWSETSGHMASGEVSEQSDTLMTSTVEFEREATPTGHIDNDEFISESSKEIDTIALSPRLTSNNVCSDDEDICLEQSQQSSGNKSLDLAAHNEFSISSRSKDISECSEANDVVFEDCIVEGKQLENEFALSPDASIKSDRSSQSPIMMKLTEASHDMDNSLVYAERSGTESQFANETWQTESDRENTSSVSEHLSSMTSSQVSNATLQPSDEQMSDDEITVNNLIEPHSENAQPSTTPVRNVSSHRLLRSFSESASSTLKNRTLVSNFSEEKAEWEVERIMSQPSDPSLIHGDSIERPPSPAMENYPSLVDVCSPCQMLPNPFDTTCAEDSAPSAHNLDDSLCDPDSVCVKADISLKRLPDTILEEDENMYSKTQYNTTSPDEFILVEGSGGRLDSISSPPSMTVLSEVCFFPPEEIQKIDDISPPVCDGVIDADSPKQWAEMQFEQDSLRSASDSNFPNTLEDIEEEDPESTDAQLQKLKETLESSTEFEPHFKSKVHSRNNGNSNRSDSDEVSVCSLQEFERLELMIGQRGSEDSIASSGTGQCRGHTRQGSHGDSTSVGSLQEFERLEHQCDLTEQLEQRASRAEKLLSEIEEGHESQMSESDSGETLSDCESTSHTAEDERSKLFEVDQMIREAQANILQSGSTGASGLEVTDLTNSLLTLDSLTQSASVVTENRLTGDTSEKASNKRSQEEEHPERS